MTNKEVTIYGYPAGYLIDFAKSCKACGLEPADIKDFNAAVEKVFFRIKEDTQREISDTLRRSVDEAWRNGEIFKKEGKRENERK